MSDILSLHRAVSKSNCPNYMGVQIPVASTLIIKIWKHYLADYWDKQLVGPLEFGFHHASALDYSYDIECYIWEELRHGAMLGLFDHKPMALHISPFMTREKPDSEVRRTIVDLSWPNLFLVNAGVQKNAYLASNFVLKCLFVDDIFKKMIDLRPGSLLYKVNIS